MVPILQVLSGGEVDRRYELLQEKIRLGRHPACEVHIDLNSVSRFHAQILREEDQFVIEDLNSRNGTFVNGKRIEGRVILKDNDRVKICDMLFVYHGRNNDSTRGISSIAEEQDGTSTVLSTMDVHSSVDMFVKVKAESKLRAILEISQAIAQTLELDAVFGKMLESLFKIFPQADRALVILSEGGRLIPRAVRHRRDEETVRFSRTIVQQALHDKKAVLSADASSDDRFNMSQSIADFRIRSVMCAPLLSQDLRPLGAIQIDTQNYHQQFSEEDLQILLSVASQAAISIENAQLHAEILNQERIQQELAFANQVQKGFLPTTGPKVAGYEFWSYYEAAGQVGGDYFNYVALPNDRHAIIVGDVAGKGVPAALLMAKATSDSKVALLTFTDDLGKAMGQINNAICETNLDDKFITTVMCILDPKNHRMSVVNAGHMSPIIRRVDGSVEEPIDQNTTGLPIGVIEDYEYSTVEVDIQPGDTVVLFSDGINEAMNAKGEQFTIARLRNVLSATDLTAAALGERLLQDISRHVGDAKQNDDMTLVIFTRAKT
ncbi:MAG: SpoIIE family protein phosphatase [Planctomycetota bacterium]